MQLRTSTTAFAKSTRPEIGGVVQREALFSRLDGSTSRTVVWISAPPGYGKTTLAATYLDARAWRSAWYVIDDEDDDAENFFHYLAHAVRTLRDDELPLPAFSQAQRLDLAAFSRRWFRALFTRATEPLALVIDNLHELKEDSELRVVLEAGLPHVPRQCCVIVTSRGAPPAALARMQPAGQMVALGTNELKMEAGELAEMARLRGGLLAADALQAMQERADGWAAALVLMIEHRKLSAGDGVAAPETTPRGVFDYLAGELFDRFEPSMQRLLLCLACVPRVTTEIARAVSGDETATRVLLNLAHNDYFVRQQVASEGRVFVFHPLLREFLMQRALRDLPEAVDLKAMRRAARLLLESGQVEDALEMLVRCHDWEDAATVVEANAPMLLEQGREATLAAWIEQLPPGRVAARGELLAAHGAALAHVSPRGARRKLEQAFSLFEAGGDARGMLRASLGVIDAILREFDDLSALDRWLAEFDRVVMAARLEAGTPSAVMAARLWRNPTHPSVGRLDPAGDPGEGGIALVRAAAALLSGEFARAAALADAVARASRVDGATRIAVVAADALRLVLDGDHEGAMRAARAGLDSSASEGPRIHDAWLRMLVVAAALGRDDLASATQELDMVDAMPLRRGDRAFAHHLRGWLARSSGKAGEALRESRNAALLAAEAGLPWLETLARIAMAQLLASAGDLAGAEAQLRAADVAAQPLGNPLLDLAADCTRASLALDGGDDAEVARLLASTLTAARALGVHHVPGVPASLLARLCVEALRRGIATEHTQLLIRSGRLQPPPAALGLRRWPWAYEIATLGRFELARDGKPIEFSAKGPGRPVELLKVLIALGGQDARAEQLADALWPHVDADYAHKSFTATLHRLRRIFDEDDAVRLRDGRLSLNPALFWLDTRAFDDVLGRVEHALREPALLQAETLDALVGEALELYRGPFLRDEAEQPAYIACREQLRARLLRSVGRLARRLEETGRFESAADLYLRCIDADPECEGFHRNLMLCYQRHHDVASALATYARLEALLAARLRATPSPETQAIRAAMGA